MGTDGVRERLSGLPGVLTCAVTEDSVTLEALPGTDLRLLRARAEAVCATEGDARSVVVVLGAVPAPPPAVTAGATAVLRRAGRPDVVATLSALVLAFVVLAPDRSSTPLTPAARTELAATPSGGAEATAAASATRARRTGPGVRARGTTVDVVPDGLAAEAVLTSGVTAALTLAPPAEPVGRALQRPAPAAARLDPAPSAAATPPATPAPAPPAAPVVAETPAGTAVPTTTVAPVPGDDDGEAARRGGPADPPADARRDPPTPPATPAVPATGGQPDAGAGRDGGRRP